MRVLLIGTYELGRQPTSLATAAAALAASGHDVDCLDLSVQDWDLALVGRAGVAAISVPMHTAMRTGLAWARRLRDEQPALPICLFGLYATVGHDGADNPVDHRIAGEFDTQLAAWVDAVAAGPGPRPGPTAIIDTGRHGTHVPVRSGLPPLERYARLATGGVEVLAASVDASRGCSHRCRHCPVPVIYDGRVRLVDEATVLADIEQVVEAGARHVTFGDPDFLNAPWHALRIARALHARWPDVTFDCTTKVEHILRHHEVWPELAEAGCLFVVSAFESTNDDTLAILDKGHTVADMAAAIVVLRRHGIEIRPSFLPFTPWTSLDDLCDLVDFVAAHDLVGNVDAVQLTIRLLVPEGSLLVGHPAMAPWLGAYDQERLGFQWTQADPRVDQVQADVASLVEAAVARGEDSEVTFGRVRDAFYAASGRAPEVGVAVSSRSEGPPGPRARLTEAWFCCAEPTTGQLAGAAALPLGPDRQEMTESAPAARWAPSPEGSISGSK